MDLITFYSSASVAIIFLQANVLATMIFY
jgi:hypothetical protein